MTRAPSSLAGRLLLPLAAGLFLLQAGVFFWTLHIRIQEQFRLVASDRSRLAITQYQLFAAMNPGERAALVARLSFQNFSLRLCHAQPFAQNHSKESLIFLRRLQELYGLAYPLPDAKTPMVTDIREFNSYWSVTPHPDMLDQFLFSRFSAQAALMLPDGAWLIFDYHSVPVQHGNMFSLLMELGVQFLLQILLAWAVIRWLTRPLRQLADVAECMPASLLDAELHGLPEGGSSEVERASRAFRDMHARIRGFVEERMRLLASISHDLRTPIARLRLQLEREPSLERPELVFDALDDLQRLAEDAVSLARTGKNSEAERKVNLVALLESMVADYEEWGECLEDGTCPVRLRIEAEARCQLRPDAFRRCLENLIDNGLRYGERVDIWLNITRDEDTKPMRNRGWQGKFCARIRIEDQGPGIPDDKLDAVFEPFYRLDGSRNTRTGGTGLGLGIARDLARLNHSDIRLSNREGGGLRATLLVPLADEGS